MKRKCVICRCWIRTARKLRRLPLAGKPCAHVGCLKIALVCYRAEIRKQTENIKRDLENALATFKTFTNKRGKPFWNTRDGKKPKGQLVTADMKRFGVKSGNVLS